MSASHTIGRLARATGCKVQTIRYYEQIGLLPEPVRSEGNQRLYGQDDIDRQLAELGAGGMVDDELSKMKAELGMGTPAPAPAELEAGGESSEANA